MRPSKFLLLLPLSILFGCPGTPKPDSEPEESKVDSGTDDSAIENTAPTATITSHSDGDTVREGTPVTIGGRVADVESGVTELAVTWIIDGVEQCTGTAAADGTTSCQATFGPGGGQVRLEVRDPEGAVGSAELSLAVTETSVPTATITAPDSSGQFYSDVPIAFAGVVSDVEDPATALTVLWEDSIQGTLTTATTPAADGSLTESGLFEAGSHTLRLQVTDSDGKVGQNSISFTVGGPNQLPTCSFSEPTDGGAAATGSSVTFVATAADPDVAADQLSARWSSDLDGDLGPANVAADGTVFLTTAALSEGTQQVVLTLTDEVGGVGSCSLRWEVASPPSIAFVDPLDGDIRPEGSTFSDSFLVTAGRDSLDHLTVVYESDVDGLLGTGTPDATGSLVLPTDLSQGYHNLTATVTDSYGLSGSQSILIYVDALPTAPTVGISPDPATTDDDLSVTVSGSVDPDGVGTLDYTYVWYVDGLLSTASTSAALPAAATSKGQVWTVEVTPTDGYGSGPSGSASVSIVNSNPELVATILGAARAGEVLTCVGTGSDPDGDSLSLDYRWEDGAGSLLASGDSWTVDAAYLQPGDGVVCVVSADDGDGGTATATATVQVENSEPVVTGVQVSPGSGRVGDSLSCSGSATDADGGTPTLDYAWYNGSTWIASGSSYTIAEGDTEPGDTLTCVVTATDGDGGSSSDSATAGVLNTDPVVSGATISASTGRVGDTLSCAATVTDADGGSPTLSYAWYNGSTLLGSRSTYTLTAGGTNPGDTLTCVVTATDGSGGTDSDQSTATVLNSDPVISGVQVSASTAEVGDSLSCSGRSSDADAESVTLVYTWYNGSTAVGTGTSYIVSAADVEPGDTLSCVVTGTDPWGGTGSGQASTTIDNIVPVVSSVTMSASTGQVGDTLTCSANATDGDGSTLSYSYTFTNVSSGATVGTSSSYTITAADTDPGDSLRCTVVVSDPQGASDSDVASATVLNSLPTAPTVSISPTDPIEAVDPLLCTSTTSTDADGDTISYTYSWTVDGVSFANPTTTVATGDTVPAVSTLSDDVWVCTVTVSDGRGGGNSGSASVTVEAALPDLVVDATTVTLSAGTYAYDDVSVINGGRLQVSGVVIIESDTFYVDSSSNVYGVGLGYAAGTSGSRTGQGTGGGTGSSNSGAGGGGYGGAGGTGGYDASDTVGTGGASYGTSTGLDLDAGSGGGYGGSTAGAAGGAAIWVDSEIVQIAGSILMTGAASSNTCSGCGGGGAGGGILLQGDQVSITGTLNAAGGAAGTGSNTANDSGGGGGGGRIKVFYDSAGAVTGTTSVAGGLGGPYGMAAIGQPGSAGTYTTNYRAWP